MTFATVGCGLDAQLAKNKQLQDIKDKDKVRKQIRGRHDTLATNDVCWFSAATPIRPTLGQSH